MCSKPMRYVLLLPIIFMLALLTVVSCEPDRPQTADPTFTIKPTEAALVATTPTLIVEPDVDPALGVTCAPPCWLDIQPGVTTMQEAKATLEHYLDAGVIEPWTELDWDECPDITLWPIDTPPRVNGALVIFKAGTDTVYRIDTGPFPLYTLGQLVDRYGPPEFVSQFDYTMCSDCSKAAPFWAPGQDLGQSIMSLAVYYPSQGMEFYMTAPIDMEGCMCSDMVVEEGSFFVPMDPDEFLNSRLSSDSDSYCELFLHIGPNESITEWHGFGPGYSSDTSDSDAD